MTDLKMVVTRYRQRPPAHQEAGEADPLERWIIKNYFLSAHKMSFSDAKVILRVKLGIGDFVPDDATSNKIPRDI